MRTRPIYAAGDLRARKEGYAVAGSVLQRILRETGVGDLLEILSERLAPTDLQSLLLAVFQRRATRVHPADLLAQHTQNRFVLPAAADLRALAELDRLALTLSAPAFDAMDLAPVCPLGTTAALAPVDQNSVVATIRNTEVVSDATNVLALECACRRRAAHRDPSAVVRLCTSHRLVRAQNYNRPGLRAHFRLFSLCTAGRGDGSLAFEMSALMEHLVFHLDLLAGARDLGYPIGRVRVALTALDPARYEAPLATDLVPSLAARYSTVDVDFDQERRSERGYYARICFHIYAGDASGAEQELVDGGFTNWTEQLLSDRRERLLISAVATERICAY